MRRVLLGIAAAAALVALVWGAGRGIHYLGCPSWCWTCDDQEPCELHGGVRGIHGGGLLGPLQEYVCKDGTVEP